MTHLLSITLDLLCSHHGLDDLKQCTHPIVILQHVPHVNFVTQTINETFLFAASGWVATTTTHIGPLEPNLCMVLSGGQANVWVNFKVKYLIAPPWHRHWKERYCQVHFYFIT